MVKVKSLNIWICYYYIHIESCQLLKEKVTSWSLDHFHACNFNCDQEKEVSEMLYSSVFVPCAEYIDFVLFNSSLFFVIELSAQFFGIAKYITLFLLFFHDHLHAWHKKSITLHIWAPIYLICFEAALFCFFFLLECLGITSCKVFPSSSVWQWLDMICVQKSMYLGICVMFILVLWSLDTWEKMKKEKSKESLALKFDALLISQKFRSILYCACVEQFLELFQSCV